MTYAQEVLGLLDRSMFYPCSEDDGTPIKRCGNQFPLYVYCDYSLSKNSIVNRLRGYELVEVADIDAVDLFGKSFPEMEREYHERLVGLPLRYEDPYILFARFKRIGTNECIITVNIRFEAIGVYKELYLRRKIVPQGFAHLRCGIGFGGNYYTYVKELNDLLSTHGLPEYLLSDELCTRGRGDYLDILRNYRCINTWPYYRPAYRQSGVDNLYKRRDALEKYSLLHLIQESNKPGQDNGRCFVDPTRRDSIITILRNNPRIELLHKDSYLLMYHTGIAATGDVALISCHIDHPYRQADLFVQEADGSISGTLDNSAGIGALLYSLQEYEYGENVIITFTGGEEEGFLGAERTRDFLEENMEELYDRLGLVLTVDVTEENPDKDVSIENLNVEEDDYENTMVRFKNTNDLRSTIQTALQGMSFGVVDEGEPDEGHYYAEYDLNAVSVCLPCVCDADGLHSPRGCTTKTNKVESLAQAIHKLTQIVCAKK
jgi:hypothetical protein